MQHVWKRDYTFKCWVCKNCGLAHLDESQSLSINGTCPKGKPDAIVINNPIAFKGAYFGY